jgi:hypothetical protein
MHGVTIKIKAVLFTKLSCVLIKRLNVRRLQVVLCGCSNLCATTSCERVHGEPNAVFMAVVLNVILHCHRKALFDPS